jgi:hypothetical protein
MINTRLLLSWYAGAMVRSGTMGCLVFALFVLVDVAGCRSKSVYKPMDESYYLNPDVDLKSLGRVALVEFNNRSSYPDFSRTVSDALFNALQKKQRFGLVTVAQNEQIWRNVQADPDAPLSPKLLLDMQRSLKSSAVLTGVITQYEPYPHTKVGLRMKLINLRDGKLVWAVEQVWDSSDRSTQTRIRAYLDGQQKSRQSKGAVDLATVSTKRYMQFVAYEVAETL